MPTPIFPRETVEFLPVQVFVDTVPVTQNVQFSVTAETDRPATFGSAVTLGTAIGVMVENYSAGAYTVWAQITSYPETPVVNCGSFIVE